MAENSSDDKLIAVARHIAKTLGHSDTTASDILHIFSDFDNRFRHKLTPDLSSFKSLDRRISPFLSSDLPIWSDSSSSALFLNSVDDLISLIGKRNSPPAAADLLHLSMLRLLQEFNAIINCQVLNPDNDVHMEGYGENVHDDVIPIARPIIDYDIVIDPLPPGTVSDLNAIAKRMASCGYSARCCHVYALSRREFLEESLSRLGLMTWPDDLDGEIGRWRNAAAVAVRILFPSERRLCDRVFLGLPDVADVAFAESCQGPAARVLGFADAVASGSRAPDRLFKVLDLYETVLELTPEMDRFCDFLNHEAVMILRRLGEAVRGIFMELENLIRRDPAKAAVPGGGLHPITRYVCNYLRAACKSRGTLEVVFKESSLSVQMGWIMELLESNLVAKSKMYEDSGLCSVFMMNNGRYIIEKVRNDELGYLLGDDWIRKHEAKVRQYHLNYQRSSWNKVLGLLKSDSADLASNGGSRGMREKLKAFNACFDEICKTQSAWVVFDEHLKEELRKSILGNLLPLYTTFLGRFRAFLDIGKNDRHIKYSVQELEARIHELFRGSPASANSKK